MRKLIVISPSLKDSVGHYYSYDSSYLEEAKKMSLDVVLLVNKNIPDELYNELSQKAKVLRVFTYDLWGNGHKFSDKAERLFEEKEINREYYREILLNNLFYKEAIAGIKKLSLKKDDIVFCHSFTTTIMGGLAKLIKATEKTGAQFHLLFRYPVELCNKRSLGYYFKKIEGSKGNIYFLTDSYELIDKYSRYTHLPFGKAPIPHTFTPKRAQSNAQGKFKVGILGNPRSEKGVVEAFKALELVNSSESLDGIEFYIQTIYCEDGIKPILYDLRSKAYSNVHFIDGELSNREYEDLVESLDLVLAPYHFASYQDRTSGILNDTVSKAVPLVVTRGTWLEAVGGAFKSVLVCEDRDPRSILKCIKKIYENQEYYKQEALSASKEWIERHNPGQLLLKLTNPEKRVLSLYPWDIAAKSGASSYVKMINRFCHERHKFRHTVITDSRSDNNSYKSVTFKPRNGILKSRYPISRKSYLKINRLLYSQFRSVIGQFLPKTSSSGRLVKKYILLDVLKLLFKTRNIPKNEYMPMWFYFNSLPNKKSKLRLSRLYNHFDILFSYYTFTSWAYAKGFSGKKFLFTIDVISDQAKNLKKTKRVLERLEKKASSNAEVIVSINQNDADYYKQKNSSARSVVLRPNVYPCDKRSFDLDAVSTVVKSIVKEKNYKCLFVGSEYAPNIEAVKSIFCMASALDGSNVKLITAGTCWKLTRNEKNLNVLGLVSDDDLEYLYQNVDLVLIPLMEGTGSSVKFFEAYFRDKAILTTSVGMRGATDEMLDTRVIVEDDIVQWPHRLRAMSEASSSVDKIEGRDFNELKKSAFKDFEEALSDAVC